MNTYRNEDDSRRRDPRGRDGKYRFSPEQRYQEREREEDTLPLTVADVRRAMRAEQEERRQASRYQQRQKNDAYRRMRIEDFEEEAEEPRNKKSC